MLQSIRDRLTGILAFVILGILVIPFAFVGVNSYFQSGTENMVAIVNDQEITFNEFNQSYLDYRRRMQNLMGDAFDPSRYETLVARREHLDRMIDETLLSQVADRLNLQVDDERLAERIRNLPAFQVDGEFSPEVYQARLLTLGLTPMQFQDRLREQITVSQLPNAITASSFATATEIEEFVALQNQTRTFTAVVVPGEVDSVTREFSEEEIAGWYQNNLENFRTDEQVVIEYLELDAAELASNEEPEDEFLRERFEQQKNRFIAPEQRLVSHILVEVSPEADEATRETARQRAQDIAARARSGEDFAALAEELSDDLGSAQDGGDLGWLEPGVMAETFEDAMYGLTMEQPISDPVQTSFGWHVIKLRDIRESTGQSFEEARPTLVAEYREELAERDFLELADRMVDVVYEDPTTLEAASLDLGVPVQTEGPFGRDGGAGIAANPKVVDAAFSDLVLTQGSASDPIDLGPNHMVMIRVREHLPSVIRPLEEVRDEVIASLRREAAAEAARERAADIVAALEAGGDPAEVADDAGLEVVMVEDAKRFGSEPDPVVVSNVFELPAPEEGAVHHAVVEAASGFAAIALREVTAGSLDADAPLAEQQFRRQIANANASTEAWALVRQLRESGDIQVFEENLGVSR